MWFPAREVVRRTAGAPDPDGTGAIRVMRICGLALEERVVGAKPGERLELSLVAGAPVRALRSEIRLLPGGGATRVRWSLAFRPLVPGTGRLLGRLSERVLRRGLAGLRRAAEEA